MLKSEHVNDTEMRALLREAYSRDPERSFLVQLARHFVDPAMPLDASSRQRVHPVWLTLGLIAAFLASVFLVCTLRS